ncbi:MAG: hypothetical protein WDW36_005466 [Sanguina aurantia]
MPSQPRYLSSSSSRSSSGASTQPMLQRRSLGHSSGQESSSQERMSVGSAPQHPAPEHSKWWTKMDSGRMNDAHAAEMLCEEAPLGQRLQQGGGEHVHGVSQRIAEIVRGLHPPAIPAISEAGPCASSP